MANESEFAGEVLAGVDEALLMADIESFLGNSRLLSDMMKMDAEIAEVITLAECEQVIPYKQFCLQELGAKNLTPGSNPALYSALERGFILGYWLARQGRGRETGVGGQ